MIAPAPETAARPGTPRAVVVLLLFAIALANYADRYLLAGLAGPIQREFGLSDTVIGVLLGPAFALLLTALGVPAARLADRRSRIAVACAGCLMWSLFTLLTALAHDALTLAIARAGVGIGEAGYQAPVAALIAAYFPQHQRGRAFAALGTAIYFGQMIGIAGGPAIAEHHGWRAPFAWLGSAGVVLAAVAWLTIREPPRAPRTVAAPDYGSLRALAAGLARTRSWALTTAGFALGTFSGVSFGLWGVVLFQRAYGLGDKAAGTAFGLPFGLAGLAGMIGFGMLADRPGRGDGGHPLRLSALALAAATAAILAVTWLPTLRGAQLVAVPAGLLGGGWATGVLAALQHLLPARHRAAGTALALLVMGICANLGGPWLTGALSQAFGAGAGGLRLALSCVIPAGFIGALALWRASRSLEADRLRLTAQTG